MTEPYIAEIRMFGFDFPPRGYALCDGQILSIDQNQSLFSLLGSAFGGDGLSTFGLPDLRGRTPVHVKGTEFERAQKAGEENHSLTAAESPAHTHTVLASSDNATVATPAGNLPGTVFSNFNVYGPANNLTGANTNAVSNPGGAGHNNMQPFLVISFCIALSGIFPPRN